MLNQRDSEPASPYSVVPVKEVTMTVQMRKLARRMIGLILVAIIAFCLTLGGIKLIRHDGVFGVGQLAFSPTGDLLAVNGSLNRTFTLAVFDPVTKRRITILDPPSPAWGCLFSSDGQYLVSWGEEEITFWETRKWKVIRRQKLTTPPEVLGIKLTPDAKKVAFQEGKTVKVWDALENKELFTISLNDDGVHHLAFSPDSSLLAIASEGTPEGIGPCRVVDLETRQNVLEFQTVGTSSTDWPGISTVTFSPDGNTLAVAERKESRISIWDVKQRKRQKVLKGHLQSLSLAFSPDGKLLASGEASAVWTGELRVWNWSEEKELISLTSMIAGPVKCLAFSPDGKTLAYGMSGRQGGFEFLNVEDFCKPTPK